MSIEEKTPDLTRYVMNGETMGTRYSAIFHAKAELRTQLIEPALFDAVNRVDCQMSTWKPDSDLMRLNTAPIGAWVKVPAELMTVLRTALDIGRQSNGAFDIALGELVNAWGFGAGRNDPDAAKIREQLGKPSDFAHELLDLDDGNGRVRKLGHAQFDLSGIAKGFAVDEMVRCLQSFGIEHALVSLDGELRSIGQQNGTSPWSVALETPDYDARATLGVISLEDAAVATSGDYRHWVELGQSRLSHTMDRQKGGPLMNHLASVTVVAPNCIEADAWATVLLVLGEVAGPALARARSMNALFLTRRGDGIEQIPVGSVFE